MNWLLFLFLSGVLFPLGITRIRDRGGDQQQWRRILDQPMIKSSTICPKIYLFGCQSKASINSYLLIYVFSKYLIPVYCIRFQYILVDRVLLPNALPRYLDPLLLANLGSACACAVVRALYLLCLAMHLLSSGPSGWWIRAADKT